ncbi:MAG: SurA N-terminal domain-containing protein, partial [Eggerthellaceae bacterium]|nr:SurA N-terminal domain-containing protein [Eggerthellaceae bacterium]
MKPTLTRILTVSSVAACLAGVVCLSGCTDDKPEQPGGPVAATLGDRTVYEDEVTRAIEAIRSQYGYTEDVIWAMVLQQSGLTPATLRESIIKDMTIDTVIPVAAQTMGISVDSAEVDEAVDKMKTTYGLTDEQWETALTSSGYTEETYRSAVELSMIDTKLREEVAASAEITDEQFMEYGMMYVQY